MPSKYVSQLVKRTLVFEFHNQSENPFLDADMPGLVYMLARLLGIDVSENKTTVHVDWHYDMPSRVAVIQFHYTKGKWAIRAAGKAVTAQISGAAVIKTVGDDGVTEIFYQKAS